MELLEEHGFLNTLSELARLPGKDYLLDLFLPSLNYRAPQVRHMQLQAGFTVT